MPLTLGALGVVFGDIGTSPLYAFQQVFVGDSPMAPASASVYGVLSLIFWTLTLVVSVKYVLIAMRADNDGEGGIMALAALTQRHVYRHKGVAAGLMLLGVVGASLFYGDSMITPAVSVMSAVEGLEVVDPDLAVLVIPLSVVILLALFGVQRWGTARLGAAFGPVMLLWFGCIGVLGLLSVLQTPEVLRSISPTYAVAFLTGSPMTAFFALGSVILCVTGAEAFTLGCSGLLRNHSSEASGSTSKSRPPGRIVSVLRWSSWLPVETGPLGNLASSVRMRPSSRWTSSAAPSNCRW